MSAKIGNAKQPPLAARNPRHAIRQHQYFPNLVAASNKLLFANTKADADPFVGHRGAALPGMRLAASPLELLQQFKRLLDQPGKIR